MVLRMSRPTRHRKTGIYLLRKRVPADLVATIRRREIVQSLHTRDPEEAKRLHSIALSEIESNWAGLRRAAQAPVLSEGSYDDEEDPSLPAISEREALSLAQPLGQQWIDRHCDEPSSQTWWPDRYDKLWDVEADLNEGHDSDHVYLRDWMRRQCRGMAIRLLSKHRFSQEYGLDKTARAISVIIQKASFEVEKMARGEVVPTGPAVRPDTWQSNVQSINVPANTRRTSLTLSTLVEMWWGESRRSGLTESTYESYRNTFKNFVTFLKHEHAVDVTFADVVAFKNYRLENPSTRTGKVVSAKTVKDGDLAALKAVFRWAVNNGLMAD